MQIHEVNPFFKMRFPKALPFATILILFSLSLNVNALEKKKKKQSHCNFKAIYNFGDSNSDTGAISAALGPRPWPNGQTFFHKPSGRVSDGRLIIDFIAEHLGLPFLSPYLDPIGTSYHQGANFATGGSTIIPQNKTIAETGTSPFPLYIQMNQFTQFKSRFSEIYTDGSYSCKGRMPRPKDFPGALYTFDIGQNDLTYGFRTMTDAQNIAFIPNMIEQIVVAVQNLYSQGGRTFWIHNTSPVGCLPVIKQIISNPGSESLDQYGCIRSQNAVAIEFNGQLKNMVIKLRRSLPEAAITYVDIYAAKYELITNAKQHGFVDVSDICCGYHKNGINVGCGGVLILQNGTRIRGGSCEDPSKYISWDGLHFTEAANHWIANLLLNGSVTDPSFPITNVCHKLP